MRSMVTVSMPQRPVGAATRKGAASGRAHDERGVGTGKAAALDECYVALWRLRLGGDGKTRAIGIDFVQRRNARYLVLLQRSECEHRVDHAGGGNQMTECPLECRDRRRR